MDSITPRSIDRRSLLDPKVSIIGQPLNTYETDSDGSSPLHLSYSAVSKTVLYLRSGEGEINLLSPLLSAK